MATRSSSGDVVPLSVNRGRVDADTIVYDDDPAARAAVGDELVRPSTVGRYMVLDLIGVGGMGVVCTAYDPKLDRKVAIKLLKERTSDERRNTMGRARLVREAQALAKLSHPNIITVHDVDTHEDRLFIAMEYVQGQTLADWLEAQSRPWREVLDVFGHAGAGLAAAHAAGVTHRDFKPSNVLIGEDGRVRVLDFGLAKTEGTADDSQPIDMADESSDHDDPPSDPQLITGDPSTSDIMNVIGSSTDLKLTQAGRVVGTLAYMPPEQHLGEGVGPATDQFAFAVSIHEALYGELPFGEEGSDEAFWRAAEGDIAAAPARHRGPRVGVQGLAPRAAAQARRSLSGHGRPARGAGGRSPAAATADRDRGRGVRPGRLRRVRDHAAGRAIGPRSMRRRAAAAGRGVGRRPPGGRRARVRGRRSSAMRRTPRAGSSRPSTGSPIAGPSSARRSSTSSCCAASIRFRAASS